ncbi:MAG: amidinotransferase, partial [Gammaproteobacteria bacterium]|nr:amidinotransferase [Gammaproteobacteria bacterium]
ATKATMEAAGCRVQTFDGDALCIACEGGPTCLTRPILRS